MKLDLRYDVGKYERFLNLYLFKIVLRFGLFFPIFYFKYGYLFFLKKIIKNY